MNIIITLAFVLVAVTIIVVGFALVNGLLAKPFDRYWTHRNRKHHAA